jgi:hypothetical protein
MSLLFKVLDKRSAQFARAILHASSPSCLKAIPQSYLLDRLVTETRVDAGTGPHGGGAPAAPRCQDFERLASQLLFINPAYARACNGRSQPGLS